MNARTAITMAALLALGACGGGDKADGDTAGGGGKAEGESAAAGGGTGAKGSGVKLRAGQWESTTEVVNVSAPGLPPGIADQMKTRPNTGTMCITEKEASEAAANVFTGKKDANCDTKGFSADGGRVNGTITCKAEEGGQGKMTMTMDGEFKPESYALTTKMETEGGGNPMTIESKISGKRIGDCPAGAEG